MLNPGIRQRQRLGATTVEMAFVAPFIFLLVFSSFEFSRMMMVQQALTNAAREGCRHAALVTTQNTSESDVVVREMLRGVINQDGEEEVIRVDYEPEDLVGLAPGTTITTVVEVDCGDVSWLPPLMFGGAKISATSSMTRE